MSRHTRDALRQTLADEVRRLQRATDTLDEVVAEHLRVNRTDLRCLDLLLDRGSASPGEIAEALGLTTGSVTAMLDRLEALDYVRRMPDPADRRRLNVLPTEHVIDAATALYGPLAEEGARDLVRYSTAELELLIAFTRRDRELQERHAARLRSVPANSPRASRRKTR